MSRTRYLHVSTQGKLSALPGLAEALAARKRGGYLWIDLIDPTREELTALVEPLGVHPLSVEDCLDQDQVPKVESFPATTFILFNSYRYADRQLSIDEVNFILGEGFLITVNAKGSNLPGFSERLAEAIEVELPDVRKGPDFLLHVVMDRTVDEKFAAIEALQEELDSAEEMILKGPSQFHPEELMHLRRCLLALRKSLFHERETLVKICRRDSPFISEKAIYHFRDIYDHLAKFFEVTEMYREMISNLMETYLSLVNNEMARAANRTNQTVRRLTLITTVFMPLTLFAGVGGMSEWSMMTGPQNWRIAYPAFMLAMLVLGAVNYYLLKWVERRNDGDEAAAALPRGSNRSGHPGRPPRRKG